MNLCKRAVLYVMRKRGKSVLLALLFVLTATLVLSGLASLDAEEQQSSDLRGATGTSFTVERGEEWGGNNESQNGSSSNFNTADLISDDMIKKIAEMQGIKGYNAIYETVLTFDGKKQNQTYPSAETIGQYYRTYGSIDTQYSSFFLGRKFALIEGRHINPDDTNAVLISEEAAKKLGKKLGDTISAVNDPLNNDPYKQLKIVGIFEVLADQEDTKDQWSMDGLYDYNSNAFVAMPAMQELLVNYPTDGPTKGYINADFYVDDPQQLEHIIQEVQKIDSIDWDDFSIKANDEVFERTENSMSNISTLIRTLLLIMVVISITIITLILTMWMKSRTKETGILLSSGISKISILLQHVIETMIIAAISFPLAYLCSNYVAGFIARLFGKQEMIEVSLTHFVFVCAIGSLLLILAIVISCLRMLEQKPKEIL